MEFNASDVDQGPEKGYDLSPATHICGRDGTGFGLLIPTRALLIFSKYLLQVKVTASGILSPSPLRASYLPLPFLLGVLVMAPVQWVPTMSAPYSMSPLPLNQISTPQPPPQLQWVPPAALCGTLALAGLNPAALPSSPANNRLLSTWLWGVG